MPSITSFTAEDQDLDIDMDTAVEVKRTKKIKNKEGKKAKSVLVDQEVEPDCEPPTKKKKKKSTLAVDPVNGHEDKTSGMNGVDASPQEDTEEPKEKKKKRKKASSETNGDVLKTNGHSSPVKTPALTPCPSSIDSASDSEKDLLTKEQKEGAFSNFKISQDTIERLKARGVTHLFDIQVKTFNSIYSGKDVIGQARTGTGKTFSFAIPLVEKLQNDSEDWYRGRAPKVLVLTPTRELAIQVAKDFKDITKKLAVTCFYGGSSYNPQIDAIRSGIDVLVGTPGRIKDHLQNQKLDLSKLKHVVLDEVDSMLDMGFAEQVEEILATSYKPGAESNPQTLLFSATCPPWVYQVAKNDSGCSS